MWNLILVRLEIVLVSEQDRCTACAQCTIGLKMFWTHLIEHLGDVGHVESHFSLFRDSVSIGARFVNCCAKRTIGLEVVLNTTDSSPRW
jgi:hypothetical protein